MADFQDIDRTEHSTLDQQGLHRCLRITGEQRAERAELEQGNNRGVVRGTVRQRTCAIGLGRIENLKLGTAAELDDLTRGRRVQSPIGLAPGGINHATMPFSTKRPSAIHKQPHPVTTEDLLHAPKVILIRVSEDHDVEVTLVEGEVLTNPSKCQVGIDAAVHEYGTAIGCLDQDRVALADIEHGQVQATVRPGRHRGQGQDQYQP